MYFCREKQRWIGPDRVVSIDGGQVSPIHNERTKTADATRATNTAPPVELVHLGEEDPSGLHESTSPKLQDDVSETPVEKPCYESDNTSEHANIRHPVVTRKDRVMARSRTLNSETNTSFASFNSRKITSGEKLTAYSKERNISNDKGAMVILDYQNVHKEANIILWHVVYSVKADGSINARIVPRGDLDADKEYIRTEHPCMNLDCFQLLLSITAQSPASEDSGQLWYLTSDTTLIDPFGLTKSRYETPCNTARTTPGTSDLCLYARLTIIFMVVLRNRSSALNPCCSRRSRSENASAGPSPFMDRKLFWTKMGQ